MISSDRLIFYLPDVGARLTGNCRNYCLIIPSEAMGTCLAASRLVAKAQIVERIHAAPTLS